MSEFADEADGTLVKLNKEKDRLEAAALKLVECFGEDPRDENGAIQLSVLDTLHKFRQHVIQAQKQNKKEAETSKRRERIKKKEEARKARAAEKLMKLKKGKAKRLPESNSVQKLISSSKNPSTESSTKVSIF